MQACTTTHEVVHYVFAHRAQLDFKSVLDANNTIALPQDTLMMVLYAHTRAHSILNFCLPPSFTCLDEFYRYFHLYWSHKTVQTCQYEDNERTVGHPAGCLWEIAYLGNHHGGSTPEQHYFLENLWQANQDWLGYSIVDQPGLHDCVEDMMVTHNWSDRDVDAPYTWCLWCSKQRTCRCDTPLDWSESPDTRSD